VKPTPNQALIADVRAELRSAANPAKAAGMQAYMKSAMPFLGVMRTPQKLIYKMVSPLHELTTVEIFRQTVLALWREAEYREERYAPIALTGDKRFAAWQRPELIDVYEEFIVTGGWWDYVDSVAIHRIGPIFGGQPPALTPLMTRWSIDADKWKRRTAIISQLWLRDKLDFALVQIFIENNLDDTDFFIRKAIGWVLREHAKLFPDRVEAYVIERSDRAERPVPTRGGARYRVRSKPPIYLRQGL
jgi:3-methyladenine DNA glycosylase AlkD